MNAQIYLCVHGVGRWLWIKGTRPVMWSCRDMHQGTYWSRSIDSSHFSLSRYHPSDGRRFSCWHSAELQCPCRERGQDTSRCGHRFLLYSSPDLDVWWNALKDCDHLHLGNTLQGVFRARRWCLKSYKTEGQIVQRRANLPLWDKRSPFYPGSSALSIILMYFETALTNK